ncbi:MAG: diguanylate cyclase domain-containing protein [Neptuniibacter sp.]
MTIIFKHILVTCLIITLFSGKAFAVERKQKILVLHSYHQGLEWSDNISRGIRSVFSSYADQYELHYEYLDTKRNTGDVYNEKLTRFITSKHFSLRYAAIIAADNNALRMLNSRELFFTGDPPIIFCGINNYTEALTTELSNITGVVEKADHRSNIELIRRLHPESKRISIIVDKTPTGDAIREELLEVEKEYQGKIEFHYLRDFLLSELPAILSELESDEPIYLLSFNRDRNNNFISYTEGIEMLNKSALGPIYGAWDFYMGKGLVGGSIVSGYLQGKIAAELAIKILQNPVELKQILLKKTPTKYMFDYWYMQEHGISLSSIPEHSEVIHGPVSAYERYKKLLLVGLVVLLFLALYLFWKFKTQQVLLKAREVQSTKLEQKVYERTIELEKTNKTLQQLSNLDGLTQLYNRRFFDEALDTELKRAQRSSTPISLLMCDIDHFKKFNDSYGHLAGDDCIKAVVDSIQAKCSRGGDIAARFGGEEFAIILPNTNENGAIVIAENIRQDLAAKKIPHKSSDVHDYVTISIGIATIVPTVYTSPTDAIALADLALYESKNKGRDRVTANQHS